MGEESFDAYAFIWVASQQHQDKVPRSKREFLKTSSFLWSTFS
jgi:hypothetical protein